MTTFKQFITESPDTLVDMIRRDCQPYLERCGGHAVWRGIANATKSNYSELTIDGGEDTQFWDRRYVRKNRKPLHTSPEKSKEIDDAMEKIFGWRPRSEGLFVSGDEITFVYGKSNLIFPIGQFSYVWSPYIVDMWNSTHSRQFTQNILDFVKKSRYQNTHLEDAINSHHEIVIKCESYYAILQDVYTPELLKALDLK